MEERPETPSSLAVSKYESAWALLFSREASHSRVGDVQPLLWGGKKK